MPTLILQKMAQCNLLTFKDILCLIEHSEL